MMRGVSRASLRRMGMICFARVSMRLVDDLGGKFSPSIKYTEKLALSSVGSK